MEGISKERLLEIARQTHDSDDTNHIVLSLFDYLITECTELDPWLKIDENTPKDRPIVVYCPPYQDLESFVSKCQWHESAGFCVDELRTPTLWQELPKD
jgi:hypothetical protein